MSVDKLPSGRWRARLQIDGRRHVAIFQTKQQAQEWQTVTRAQGIQGTLPSHVTVGQYADKWLAGYEHAPANTRPFHRINLDQWILPHFANRRAAAVSPTDITMLLNTVSDRVSPARAERVYRTLSALFRSAHADDVVPKVPTRSKRHRPRRQKEPHAVLERPEARRVLLHLQGWQRDTAMIQLFLGARFGEIAGLTPHDLNMDRGTITIRRRVSTGTVRATKNHRQRTLELPRSAVYTCERLIRDAGNPPPLPDLGDREHTAARYASTGSSRHAPDGRLPSLPSTVHFTKRAPLRERQICRATGYATRTCRG